ncbi:enoyl-CoA hydratase/carnithine racemase [Salirhabdus euzebyi]|uniref:Enoyl-CoA hydratase/carnithine racemase n=1 Tax=Salirhabdus euzebyi TaxID=394506 RepID=A0A841Q6G6_9BACI|nr:enoyl-CoA hydratase [Salirhabdus euzebyi]MBB6454109.1 enoyl-CoA hydratase/carnithine racemase [Salirhabdus euzebyi]
MSNTVLLSIEENIATLTLNRPSSMNAMDIELLNTLLTKLKEVKESDAKLLVITGEGKAFSAGGDIKTMLQQADESGFHSVMNTIKEIIITLYTMPLVTVSAVNGAAAGLGLSFALASDYVLADENAKLAMNFIGIGLIPDGGGHFFMKNRLGVEKAKKLIWQGQKLTATEAYKLGLIDDVLSGNFQDELKEKINLLSKHPLKAMVETKLIYTELHRPELEKVLEMETNGQQKMRKTKDHQEGMKAFMEKRTPNFIGE